MIDTRQHGVKSSAPLLPNLPRPFVTLQEELAVPDYMKKQKDINSQMRTILVDWLIEVQENFELFHETLYLAVRLVDTYLSRREVKREYLQLVGATCMLIAAKFEVQCIHDGCMFLVDFSFSPSLSFGDTPFPVIPSLSPCHSLLFNWVEPGDRLLYFH